MDRSPYLAQALAAMGQAPQQAPQQQGIDPAMLAQVVQQRRAGQIDGQPVNQGAYNIGANLQQAGRNLMGAPGRVAQAVQGVPGAIGQVPGNVIAGLGNLGIQQPVGPKGLGGIFG